MTTPRKSKLQDQTIVLTPCAADPAKYGLPVEASGLGVVITWYGEHVVTAAVDPAALDLARIAYSLDDSKTTVRMTEAHVHWIAMGTPGTWGPWGPRWAPVTPRPAVAHG